MTDFVRTSEGHGHAQAGVSNEATRPTAAVGTARPAPVSLDVKLAIIVTGL